MTGELAENLFLAIENIDEQIKDKYAKSMLLNNGTNKVFIKRLSDNKFDWCGSLFVEYTHHKYTDVNEIRHTMHTSASAIQYILPEIRM